MLTYHPACDAASTRTAYFRTASLERARELVAQWQHQCGYVEVISLKRDEESWQKQK